jgi:hypothetical protein
MATAMSSKSNAQSSISKIGFCSLLLLFSAYSFAPLKATASIIRDAENGIHYYCGDGNPAVIGTAKGLRIGLRGNGLLIPYSEGYWAPVPGRFGCYYRRMTAATQQSILEAIYDYCVQKRRNCF